MNIPTKFAFNWPSSFEEDQIFHRLCQWWTQSDDNQYCMWPFGSSKI